MPIVNFARIEIIWLRDQVQMAMTIIQLGDYLGEVEGQDLGEVEGDHLGEAEGELLGEVEGELLVTMLLLPLLVLLGLAIHCNSEEVSLIFRKFSAYFLDG